MSRMKIRNVGYPGAVCSGNPLSAGPPEFGCRKLFLSPFSTISLGVIMLVLRRPKGFLFLYM